MNSIEITVQQLAEVYQKDAHPVILDVRELWEVEKVSLKGSMHIPLSSLVGQQAELSATSPLYVLCHYGVRSLKVALFLREQGYEAYSIQGGLDAWAREIDASIGFY